MHLQETLWWLALLGSALMGGCFFAFSSFVMDSLARRPAPEGIAAMQSINAVVINRSFLGTFLGTAALALVTAAQALLGWSHPAAPFSLTASLLYLEGTVLVTLAGNVPLNEALARVQAHSQEAQRLWRRYLRRWTRWNHLRAACAIAATGFYGLGLLQAGLAHAPSPQRPRARPPVTVMLLESGRGVVLGLLQESLQHGGGLAARTLEAPNANPEDE
jgi:uncharacterized membrane protein